MARVGDITFNVNCTPMNMNGSVVYLNDGIEKDKEDSMRVQFECPFKCGTEDGVLIMAKKVDVAEWAELKERARFVCADIPFVFTGDMEMELNVGVTVQLSPIALKLSELDRLKRTDTFCSAKLNESDQDE